MDSIYPKLLVLQKQIIAATIEKKSPTTVLDVLPLNQFKRELFENRVDSILNFMRMGAPSVKANLTALPLFKIWFYKFFTHTFDSNSQIWNTFLTFGSVDYSNADPVTVDCLDILFKEAIFTFFDESCFELFLYSGQGLDLMAQINSNYTLLSNIEEVTMIKKFFKDVNNGYDDNLIQKALIVGYYVPPMSGLIVGSILASLDIAIVREFMINRGGNNVDKTIFQVENLGTILRDLKQVITSNAYNSDFGGMSAGAPKWDNKKSKSKKNKSYTKKRYRS